MKRLVAHLTTLLAAGAVLGAFGSFRPYPLLEGEPAARNPAAISSAFAAPHWAGHSHNDYERPHPLQDALDNGFESVEADVWLEKGEIEVSHLGWVYTGSLRELYLDPIQERVTRRGSVYGDGRPFILWLDIKEVSAAFVPTLQALLSRYPMLTRVEGKTLRPGPVTIVMTGNPRIKQRYEDHYAVRYAFRDALQVENSDERVTGETDPWQWYSLNWFNYVAWDGEGSISDSEAKKLRELVAFVHGKGRKLRFWGAPETPAVWRASAWAGVDLIGADDLAGVRRTLGRVH